MIQKERVFRDPVYGNITLEDPVILEVIDSPEFQRLRRIRQLGMCFNTYYGAEHTRFQHSIGAMWLMTRILNRWTEKKFIQLPPSERVAAVLAALLHDLGHGPFSHALEKVFSRFHHEDIGRQLILQRLAPILQRHGVDVDLVLSINDGSCGRPFLSELISSQLDVDRMDYLVRDSLYAGVTYGVFDTERIVSTLIPIYDEPSGGYVTALTHKGLHAAEAYIFCRYFMYWQVYFHKTTRASEVMLRMVLQRVRELSTNAEHGLYLPPNVRFMFLGAEQDMLEHFVEVDDSDLFHCIKMWQHDADPVLSRLASGFTNRRLYKALPIPDDPETIESLGAFMKSRYGDVAQYFWQIDRPSDSAYDYYTAGQGKPVIRVVVEPPDGWKEITEAGLTGAIRAIAQEVTKTYVVIAPELQDEVTRLLEELVPRPVSSSPPFWA